MFAFKEPIDTLLYNNLFRVSKNKIAKCSFFHFGFWAEGLGVNDQNQKLLIVVLGLVYSHSAIC